MPPQLLDNSRRAAHQRLHGRLSTNMAAHKKDFKTAPKNESVARARCVFIERIIRKSESVPERTVLILSLLTVEKAASLFVPFVTISHRRITKHLLGNKHGRAAGSHYTVMPDLQDTDGACVR